MTEGSARALKVPSATRQAPYFYRFRVGDLMATIVSDGTLPLGRPQDNYRSPMPEEIDKQLEENFLPHDNVVLEQNVLVLDTGDKLILFDTGMGPLDIFGPTTGRLLDNLKEAGFDPKDIDAVVISHAHIDHCGGCMSSDDSRNFPNAHYFMHQDDYDFWTDETNVPEGARVFLETARKNLIPNRDRMTFFQGDQEILPGIHAVLAPGHTVGHTIFMIESGGASLCYIADLANHPVLLLQNPLTEFIHDTDPKQAAQSRVRLFDMLAHNRTPILAYHFAWPGLGHVAKQGDGFRYFPLPMKMEL